MMRTEAKKRFLAACALDYQTLSGLIEDARDLVGNVSGSELRAIVTSAISDLLGDGLVEAGFPEGMEHPRQEAVENPGQLDRELAEFSRREPRDWAFEPWVGEAQAALDRIRVEWDALGREPDWNEVCWFRATARGKDAAKRRKE